MSSLLNHIQRGPSVRTAARSLRALARLLAYPDAALRAHLGELMDALRTEQRLNDARLA